MPDLIPWCAKEISRLKQDFDRLLTSLFEDLGVRCPDFPGEGMSVLKEDGWWTISCSLPGFSPEDVDVSVAGRILHIVAARQHSQNPVISRRLTMPGPITMAEAAFSEGRLVVRVSCQAPSQARRVIVVRKESLSDIAR